MLETDIEFKNKKISILSELSQGELISYGEIFKIYDDKFNRLFLEDFIKNYSSYNTKLQELIRNIVDKFGIIIYNKDITKLPSEIGRAHV